MLVPSIQGHEEFPYIDPKFFPEGALVKESFR